jgi:hypothetical protein
MNRILINYKLALKTDTFMRINFNLRRIYIMKSFWNDYWDLVKESTDFYKKHWLGIVIMYIIIFVITFVSLIFPLYSDEIKSNMKKIFRKKTDNTVEEES